MDEIQSKNNNKNQGMYTSNNSENNSLNQNETSIDSSNPEKIYEELTKEIYSFPENSQNNSSFFSSISISENDQKKDIEKLLNSKYWKVDKEYTNENDEYDSDSFEKFKIFEKQKKLSHPKLKKKISLKNDFFSLVDKTPNHPNLKYEGNNSNNNKSTHSNDDSEIEDNLNNDISINNENDFITDFNENSNNNIDNENNEKTYISTRKESTSLSSNEYFIYPYEHKNYTALNNNQLNTPFYPQFYKNSLNNIDLDKKNFQEKEEEEKSINNPNKLITQSNCKFGPLFLNDYYYKINNNKLNDKMEMNIITNGVNYLYPNLNLNMGYYQSIQKNINQTSNSTSTKTTNIINNKSNIDNKFLLPNQNNTNNNIINTPELQKKESNKSTTSNISNENIIKQDKKNTNNYSNTSQNNIIKQSKTSTTNSTKINNKNNNNISNNNNNKKNNHHYKVNEKQTNGKAEKQLLNLDDIVTGKDTRTTVMIRNIPIKYSDEQLIEALEEFKGKYDCLYMPYDFEKNGNKGYAFINFVNPLHILYFHDKFNGRKWDYYESAKICELNCAHFQGINEIQKHAKNYKGIKKPTFYLGGNYNNNYDIIIPNKYLMKMKKRFPKMSFTENKSKKIIYIKSLE